MKNISSFLQDFINEKDLNKKRASSMMSLRQSKTLSSFTTCDDSICIEEIKEYKSKLPPKQNKKKEIIFEIKEQNRKIEKLRYQKNIKVDQLYTHYLKILKEGKRIL